MRGIDAILEKRKSFAIECKELFQEYHVGLLYEDFYSGAKVFQYQAFSQVTLASLPRTMVSGPVADIDFWTDGAILLKQRGRPRPTDAIIEFDKPVSLWLEPGFRVQNGFLLFYPNLHPLPSVLMLSERTWSLYDARYVDYAVKHEHQGRFYFNREETGAVLLTDSGVHAYVSELVLASDILRKLENLLEKLHAFCRN